MTYLQITTTTITTTTLQLFFLSSWLKRILFSSSSTKNGWRLWQQNLWQIHHLFLSKSFSAYPMFVLIVFYFDNFRDKEESSKASGVCCRLGFLEFILLHFWGSIDLSSSDVWIFDKLSVLFSLFFFLWSFWNGSEIEWYC